MMEKRKKRRSECPINYSLELFGDKWSFLIIRDIMFRGKRYYTEFLQAGEKISTNILADRLILLEREGIIIKKVDTEHKSKFIYQLSPKGIDLMPILVEVVLWGAKYYKCTPIIEEFVSRVKNDREGFINQISSQLKSELSS